jgi:glycerophosphoryl diester phosphodiesterase
MTKMVAAGIVAVGFFASAAAAFDLQGHRGARGLAPENTLEAFATALSIGVTTLEFDLAMTRDGILVVSHDSRLNPDHTRGPDGEFLDAEGPAIRSLTLAEVKRYDVGRLKPGTAYAAAFPEQRGMDGARIPTLMEVFELTRRARADHVRFNIETKLTPTSGADTPDPETFAAAVARAVREAKLAGRVSIQSFDWRTLVVMRRIAPEIERVCLSIDGGGGDTLQRGRPGASPWTAGLDIDDFAG